MLHVYSLSEEMNSPSWTHQAIALEFERFTGLLLVMKENRSSHLIFMCNVLFEQFPNSNTDLPPLFVFQYVNYKYPENAKFSCKFNVG